jgi:hypothetical protein
MGPVASRARPSRTLDQLLFDGVQGGCGRRSGVLRLAQDRVPLPVAELVVRLPECGVLGLPRVLDAGEAARVVDALGLQLEKDGGLARNDTVDDTAQVRPALEVVRVGDQHHLLARLPLLETVGAGATGWLFAAIRGASRPPRRTRAGAGQDMYPTSPPPARLRTAPDRVRSSARRPSRAGTLLNGAGVFGLIMAW